MDENASKMTNYQPTNDDIRKVLIFLYHLGKTPSESHRMLVEAYGDRICSEATCRRWFQRFRCNNFDVQNDHRGKPPKKFTDTDLHAILKENNYKLSQKQMAEKLNCKQQTISDRLRSMGMKQLKSGKWIHLSSSNKR